MVNMNVDKKIIEEIRRFNNINRYINEQATGEEEAEISGIGGLDLSADTGAGAPPAPGVPPAPGGAPTDLAGVPPAPPTDAGATTGATTGTTVDIENDPDVEEVKGDETEGEGEEGETEELDITDLVDTQKNMSDKQEEYFNNLFNQLQTLETKLGEMDNLVNKINNLETKFDKFGPKTPEEKLQLRTLDSGPFNQKLSDFFEDKKDDFEKSGKHEYVLTTDEIEEISPNEIKNTFNDFEDYEDKNDFM